MARRDFPIRLLVAVLVLYALLVGGTFNGVVNVQFAQTTLIVLSLGIPAWLFVRWRRGWAWHGTILDGVLLAGVAAVLLATLVNLDAGRRVTIGLWYWGMYLAVWLLLVDLLANGLPAHWLLDGVIVTGVPVVLIGYFQAASWLVPWMEVMQAGVGVPFIPLRPGSVIGNPNALGTFLVVLIPLLLSRLVQARRIVSRVGWGVYVLLTGGLLVLTLSRGAWLGLAAALGVWLAIVLWAYGLLSWQALRRWWAARGRIWQGGAIAAVLVVVIAGVAVAPMVLGAVNQPGRTFSTREAIWSAALDSFAAHPLTGTGLFTFGRTLLEHQSTPPQTPHSHTHNLVLQVAAEVGLPGLVVLAFVLGLVSLGAWRRIRRQATRSVRLEMAACSAALAGFGVHHLLDMTMMMASIALLAVLLLAALLVEPGEPGAVRPSQWQPLRGGLTLGLWGLLIASGWWSHAIQADYMRALLRADDGEWLAGAADLGQVADRDPELALYPAEQGYVLGIAAGLGESGAAEAGIAAFERALAVEDVYAPWWANLAVLRWEAGDEAGALRDMQTALAHAPLARQFWLTAGTFLEATGDELGAEATYLHALELEPRWRASTFWQESEVRARALDGLVLSERDAQETARLDEALAGLFAGDSDACQRVLLDNPGLRSASIGERVVLALTYELQGDSTTADLWMESADLALQYTWDEEWLYTGQAILAAWRTTPGADGLVQSARYRLYGNPRGYTFPTGQNLAWAQYFRDAIPEQLLPQIVSLPDCPQAGMLLDWALDRL